MEKIQINEIERKPSGLVIVKYLGQTGNSEATLNTKWQAQEVDYLEKDVGVGGTVDVVVAVKGQYTNITNVDMKSAAKGKVPTTSEKPVSINTERSNSIIAQCCMKACISTMPEPIGIDYCVRMYKEALKLLDE